jgi:hypothetical protein
MCDGHEHSIHVHGHRGRINRLLNQDFVENSIFKLILSGHSVKIDEKILKQNRKIFILNSSAAISTLHILFEITRGGREVVGGRQ